MSTKLTVYRSDARVRSGPFRSCLELARECAAHRWHIWINFRQEFAAAHGGTGLGAVWNFVLPIAPIGAYTGLATLRVFPALEGVPAAAYISFGVTLWFLFAGVITAPMNAVQARHRTVAQTSYPLIGIVVASLGHVAFETLVRLVATAVLVVVVFGVPPAAGVMALLILLDGLVLFAALGLLASMLNIVAPDVSRVVQVLLTYLLFVSCVIFPIDGISVLASLRHFNPFAVFVDNIRHAALFGEINDPRALLAWSVVGVVMTLLACRVFYVMEWRVRGVA
jgi:lipopolysaccharide transport system permease protein